MEKNENIPAQLEVSQHFPIIVSTLEQLFHHEDAIRKPAEALLRNCENAAGFSAILLEIMDAKLADETRLMAAICMKNFVHRNWKKRANANNSLLPEATKRELRFRIVSQCMRESNHQIASQSASVVANIARFDWPQHWPELMPGLLACLSSSELIQVVRSMFTLKKVLKELASRRLMMHKKAFYNLTAEIFPGISKMWENQLHAMLTNFTTNTGTHSTEELLQSIEMSYNASKIMFYLIIHGFSGLVNDSNLTLVNDYFTIVHDLMQKLVSCKECISQIAAQVDERIISNLDKLLLLLAKTVVQSQHKKPVEFRFLLKKFLSFFYLELRKKKVEGSISCTSNSFHIKAIEFLSNVISCRLYMKPKTEHVSSEDSCIRVLTSQGDVVVTPRVVEESFMEINSFFTDELLRDLFEVIVIHYMIISKEELATWHEDPEEFIQIQESITKEESVHICAENLMLSLLQHNREVLTPVLLHLIESATELIKCNRSNSDDQILQVDAIFLAFGLSYYDVHDKLEFEIFFQNTIVPFLHEIQSNSNNSANLPILRRRMLWLISCWMGQLSSPIRFDLYKALANVVSQSTVENLVVQITAVESISTLINDWEFVAKPFTELFPALFPPLYQLIAERVLNLEVRLKILQLLHDIVHIYAVSSNSSQISFDLLIQSLPSLWALAGESNQNPLRSALLLLMTEIVTIANQPHNKETAALLVEESFVPVIHYATDVSKEDSIYLMENALILWQNLLLHEQQYNLALHQLFSNVGRFIARDLEHILAALSLIESYIMLGKGQFWTDFAVDVSSICDNAIGNVKPEASKALVRAMDKIIQNFPEGSILCMKECFAKLLGSCLISYQNSASKEPDLVIVGYLSVFCRLALHSPAVFFGIIESKVDAKYTEIDTPSKLLACLIDLMLDKFFTIVCSSIGTTRRKVWAAGLSCLLNSTDPNILERTGAILDVCMEVLEEEMKEKSSSKLVNIKNNNAVEDSISQLDVRQFACEKLQQCFQLNGPVFFEQIMTTVDSNVLKKLQISQS